MPLIRRHHGHCCGNALSTARPITASSRTYKRTLLGGFIGDGAKSVSSSSSSSQPTSSDNVEASPNIKSTPPSMRSMDESAGGTICIIESVDGIKDFEEFDLKEISSNIQIRRSRIFLLMEEVRRLRIEQRLKGGGEASTAAQQEQEEQEKFVSALPFLPPLDEKTLNQYYAVYAGLVILAIGFGGIIAPILELKLGLGGTTYLEFIQDVHLPSQFAQVDPIVASFCGGSVGVLSALLIVEISNFKKQLSSRCHYCKGTGYLMCGNCVGCGSDPESGKGCIYCARSGKVMCTGCLCTGKLLATEHDPRIDPFD